MTRKELTQLNQLLYDFHQSYCGPGKAFPHTEQPLIDSRMLVTTMIARIERMNRGK